MLIKEIMIVGGPVMWLIALCSLIAVFVFIERLLYLHRIQINVGELIKGLTNVLKKGNVVEAVSLCDDTPGPAAHILRVAILNNEDCGENMERAMQDAASGEIPKMEARMNILATMAYITPLLGLLGTVIGMIGVFNTINAVGAFVNARDLAKDIGEALYTTAGGLCVSIPSYVAYNYLVSRIEAVIVDMEKASSEIIYFFNSLKSAKENNDGKQ
jgi:biopolymer transport protein ExbB